MHQSLHASQCKTATNGDGFGIGWYGSTGTPGLFLSTEPAWNDRNLRELAALASSRRVFAHIRASTGSAVQQTNCHPFRHGRWLWMHNGLVHGFPSLKRDLALAVDPELFPEIEGSTDSEIIFYLAVSFGLEQDPPAAVARALLDSRLDYFTAYVCENLGSPDERVAVEIHPHRGAGGPRHLRALPAA